MAGKVDRHAAPAAADVEDPLAGLKRQLRGDMGQLGVLRFVQGHALARPVGAAVLHVPAVEHQPVEVVADIVMVRNVALGARRPVEGVCGERKLALYAAEQAWPAQLPAPVPRLVGADELYELHDVAALDPQPAIHEGLGRAEARIEQHLARRPGVGEADRDLGETLFRFPEHGLSPVMIRDFQSATFDDLADDLVEQPHGARLAPRSGRMQPGNIMTTAQDAGG